MLVRWRLSLWVGKCVFERYFKNDHSVRRNKLFRHQAGFRSQKSTLHPILKITEIIKLGFQTNITWQLYFLFVLKLSTNPGHSGLRYKLLNYNLPKHTVSFSPPYTSSAAQQWSKFQSL